VIGREHHLAEERLFECYLAQRGGEAVDPPAAEHLSDCPDCSARYGDLLRFMDALRSDADAETDVIFTPEKLRAQEQQILRRIAHLGRPARIIDFPGRLVSRTMSASAAHRVTRWVYAAAAAGLVVGVGLGAVYQSEWARLQSGRRPTATHQLSVARSRGIMTASSGSSATSDGTEDAFLSDLDLALERPHTPSLQPFDALTPHVRDVSDRIR
jgi:hypothetical protein